MAEQQAQTGQQMTIQISGSGRLVTAGGRLQWNGKTQPKGGE